MGAVSVKRSIRPSLEGTIPPAINHLKSQAKLSQNDRTASPLMDKCYSRREELKEALGQLHHGAATRRSKPTLGFEQL